MFRQLSILLLVAPVYGVPVKSVRHMGNSTDELAIAIRDSDIKRNDSNQV